MKIIRDEFSNASEGLINLTAYLLTNVGIADPKVYRHSGIQNRLILQRFPVRAMAFSLLLRPKLFICARLFTRLHNRFGAGCPCIVRKRRCDRHNDTDE